MRKDTSFELEEREEKLAALHAALDDGEASGVATPRINVTESANWQMEAGMVLAQVRTG
jgi:hypothetical protein